MIGAVLALGALLAATPAAAQRPGRTILAIFAHPDDERIVGPLLSGYARGGYRVLLVIATDGRKPSPRITRIMLRCRGVHGSRADVSIDFEYTNPGADTIYVVGCASGVLPVLQKRQGSGWVDARIIVQPPCLNVRDPAARHAHRRAAGVLSHESGHQLL